MTLANNLHALADRPAPSQVGEGALTVNKPRLDNLSLKTNRLVMYSSPS